MSLTAVPTLDVLPPGLDARLVAIESNQNSLPLRDYMDAVRATLSGGGVLFCDSGYNIKWSERFILMGGGKGPTTAVDGYFDLLFPPVGTVIPRVGGGAASVTVTTAGINLDPWDTVYYIVPLGSSGATVNANYRIVQYANALTIPYNWLPIAVRNSDGTATFGHADTIQWANGQSQTARIPVTPTAPFANYGSNWAAATYYKQNGRVCLEGLILINGGAQGATILTLPVTFRPAQDMHNVCHAAAQAGAVNCYRDGRVAYNYGPTYVSLDAVSFQPQG